LAVVGSSSSDPDLDAMCEQLGCRAIDAGFRIASGGLGGVMEAVSRGAHHSASYREGDVIGILPVHQHDAANQHVDIVISTGMGIARNLVLVSSADVVIAVRGGSGTLSEVAFAWQLGKPVVALCPSGGWAQKLAGETLDGRRSDSIIAASSVTEAIAAACQQLNATGQLNPTG